MYRIISETTHNKTEYKIQKKLLLWWVTQRIGDIRYNTYDPNHASFTSAEEAEQYIRTYCTKPEIKTVKYIKLQKQNKVMKNIHLIPTTALEEAAENYANKKGHIPTTGLEDAIFKQGFLDGAKWYRE